MQSKKRNITEKKRKRLAEMKIIRKESNVFKLPKHTNKKYYDQAFHKQKENLKRYKENQLQVIYQ